MWISSHPFLQKLWEAPSEVLRDTLRQHRPPRPLPRSSKSRGKIAHTGDMQRDTWPAQPHPPSSSRGQENSQAAPNEGGCWKELIRFQAHEQLSPSICFCAMLIRLPVNALTRASWGCQAQAGLWLSSSGLPRLCCNGSLQTPDGS